MDGLAVGLDYVYAAICCFTAIIVLSQQESRRDHAIAMAGYLLLTGFDTIDEVAVRAGLFQTIPWMTHWMMLTVFAQPLFIYLYTLAITSQKPLKVTDLSPRHAVAFLIGVALLLPYLTLDGDIKLAAEFDRDHPAFETSRALIGMLLIPWAAFPYFLTLCLVYLALSLKTIAVHNRQIYDLFSNIENKTLRWLQIMLVILAASWLFGTSDFILITVLDYPEPPEVIEKLSMTFLLIAFCYFGLRQGAIFERLDVAEVTEDETHSDQDVIECPGEQPEERTILPRDHAERIATKLEAVMARDHLYRDSMLTLRQLSDRTRISEHHISEVLNHHIGSSFYDFVNRWRIEEAMQLLVTSPDRTALSIAMDVGFNSKSTFYAAFKNLNGQSPIAYRNAATQTAA